jgi:hypothetical protein
LGKVPQFFLAGLLNNGNKLAAGARVIHDSDISRLPVNGTHYSHFIFVSSPFHLYTKKIPAAFIAASN